MKLRCFVCKKKLPLTAIKCKCNQYFCDKHRYPEEHECTFDFKENSKKKIKENNPKIEFKKLENI
jgi:predicted nucleic acid binding AN1-type Zn finger protein